MLDASRATGSSRDKAGFQSSLNDTEDINLAKDMNRNTYQVRLGNKKVVFQLNEGIFRLDSPTQTLHTSDSQCVVCDIKLKRSHKHYW